jgi:hypothetical protein
MGKGGGSAPQAPDPFKVAAAQGAQDRQTLQYQLDNSRVGTKNNYGTTSWKNSKTFDQAGFDAAMKAYQGSYNPGTAATTETRSGRNADRTVSIPGGAAGYALPAPDRTQFEGKDNWTFEQSLSPDSQAIFDKATGAMQTGLGNVNMDANAYNTSVADAIQRRMMRLAQPGLDDQRNATRTRLADSGFQIGNEGYNTEMDRMDTNQGQTLADIADRSQITGAAQGNSDRASLIAAIQAMGGIRAGEMAGVSGATPTTQTPGMQSPDISGMMMQSYQDQLNSYNASQASNNGLMGSLIGAGAMLAAPMTGGASLGANALFQGMGGMGGGGVTQPNPYGAGNGTGLRMNPSSFYKPQP